MAFNVIIPACVFLLAIVIFSYARTVFRRGLRSLPGPLLAKFSGFYRLTMVHDGHAPERYRELHEKYGPIVRTGPEHVSISDAAMIPIIYGIGSKFLKVIFKAIFHLFWLKTICRRLSTH